MTTARAPRPFAGIDSDALRLLREGKAYRDANPPQTPQDYVEYAELDRWLSVAEAEWAAGRTAVEPTAAVESYAEYKARDGVRTAGRQVEGATEAQLRYIAKLRADLGIDDGPAPADKREASRMIEALKSEVTKARRSGTLAGWPERKATERQVEFLANLLVERDHDRGELDPATLSAAAASDLITALLAAPRAKVAAHGIAEGRYAYSNDGGVTADHYRVRRDGTIVIWTAGGEYPYTGKGLNEPLEWIKANQRDAAILFGRLTETCGRCGRDLSDDDSRKRGLGPVCAEKAW